MRACASFAAFARAERSRVSGAGLGTRFGQRRVFIPNGLSLNENSGNARRIGPR